MSVRPTTSEPICILGGGGHAKVVIATLCAAGCRVRAVYDDDPDLHGQEVLGLPVEGAIDAFDPTYPAVIAIGEGRVRQQIAERFPEANWARAIHPSATVDPTATVGPGTVIFAGAVVQPEAVLGAHVIVNTGATVDHDCQISPFAHLAPGTHLAGEVTVGEGALLGIGSACLPGTSVGAWATVGGGTVVNRDVPDRVVAVGVPVRWSG